MRSTLKGVVMEDLTVDGPLPFVSVVIPVLNEERFIVPLLQSLGCLGGKKCLKTPHEVIVVDGGSTDRTLEILAGIAAETDIRVIHNPARIQSAGVNLAARSADSRSRYLVRVDAHSIYEKGFVERIVTSLVETGASSVVVPLITRPHNPSSDFAWAVAAAQRSKLGNGGSAHRLESTPAHWTEHGHHAGFDLAFFRSVGGYDETFVTNEDAEYDVRVLQAGGKIWFEPSAKVWYSPRESAASLARQYYRYGIGRASTVLKHSILPKPRQMVPVAAFLANAGALVVGLALPIALLIPLAYLAACTLAMVSAPRIEGQSYKLVDTVSAVIIMHMAWAAGFLKRIAATIFGGQR